MNPLTSRAVAGIAVAAIASSTVAGPAGAHAGDDKDRVPLFAFSNGEQITGASSTLTRTDDGIGTQIRTRDQARHAYTVWYVIFNDPTQCNSGACGTDDLFVDGDMNQGFNTAQIAAARISVVWGNAGAVANPAGRVKLDGGIAEGEIPPAPTTVVIGLDEHNPIVPQEATGAVVTGLEDARTAEVHIVIQEHGVAHDDPDLLAQQLSQFQGACNPACHDVQFAVHQP